MTTGLKPPSDIVYIHIYLTASITVCIAKSGHPCMFWHCELGCDGARMRAGLCGCDWVTAYAPDSAATSSKW
jgi:hypothetical protein